jgi:hypothetical protein
MKTIVWFATGRGNKYVRRIEALSMTAVLGDPSRKVLKLGFSLQGDRRHVIGARDHGTVLVCHGPVPWHWRPMIA